MSRMKSSSRQPYQDTQTKPTMNTAAIATNPSKWRGLRDWIMTAVVLLCLAPMASKVQAQTNIIYEDNFARTGLLNGSTPNPVNTGGAVWYASTNVAVNSALLTDGS